MMVLVVLFDAFCTWTDIDARAAKKESSWILMFFADVCLLAFLGVGRYFCVCFWAFVECVTVEMGALRCFQRCFNDFEA